MLGLSGSTYSLRDPALVNLFGSHIAESGVTVTEFTALNNSAVWSAVRVISEGVASLPLILYRKDGDGRRRAKDHPLYHVLQDMPSEDVPALAFREAMMAHALLWGNAYAEVERNLSGNVTSLHILRPDWMRPRRDDAGNLVYEYRHPSQGVSEHYPRDIFHLRGLGFDGLLGYSVVKVAKESLGLGQAAERFGAKLFGSGARPSGVLEHPGTLSDDAARRLKNDFERSHASIENAHRIAVLEEGMKWTPLSIPPEEAQFLQTREFQIAEIARWFNLPLSKLRVAGSSYASLEAENLVFLTETLRPWLIRWEQEIWAKLLQPWERDCYHAEHHVDALLRADQASRYNAYAVGRNWGWLSVNQIRAMEGMDPIAGGDEYLQPLNMQPIQAPAGPSAPSSTPAVGTAPTGATGAPPPGPSAGAPTVDDIYEANASPVISESIQRLAQDMTAHQIPMCEHGKRNRCRICGIQKERELVPPDDAGNHAWKFKWVPIGV